MYISSTKYFDKLDYVHFATENHIYGSYKNIIVRCLIDREKFETVVYLPLLNFKDRVKYLFKITRRIFRKRIENIHLTKKGTLIAIIDGRIFRMGKNEELKHVFQLSRCRGTLHCGVAEDLQGRIFCGEYFNNKDRDPVHIFFSHDDGKTWEIIYSSPPKKIRHYHGVFFDHYCNCFWITTGDKEGENFIIKADQEFKNVEYIGDGSKRYSCVTPLITKDLIIFANDNPYSQNYIWKMDKETFKLEKVCPINGPAWYGYLTKDGIMIYATTVEYKNTALDRKAHLYVSENGYDWTDVMKWKKDMWLPLKIFNFGVINFPAGVPIGSNTVWLSGQAFKKFSLRALKLSIEK